MSILLVSKGLFTTVSSPFLLSLFNSQLYYSHLKVCYHWRLSDPFIYILHVREIIQYCFFYFQTQHDTVQFRSSCSKLHSFIFAPSLSQVFHCASTLLCRVAIQLFSCSSFLLIVYFKYRRH